MALVINLARRTDRLEALKRKQLPFAWDRLDAVNGRDLTWDELESSGVVQPEAIKEARYAEREGMPTICRRTGSFSPHLTLSAVGVACSHRKTWQALQDNTSCEYALIMEDDLSGIAPSFESQLKRLLAQLNQHRWQICFLGFHESTGKLLPASKPPQLCELPAQAAVTGLFGYLLHRRGAASLLKQGSVFPLRRQVDVAVSQMPWAPGTRFVIHPEGVLMASPKSEEGACDTDVQTLGKPSQHAHAKMPRTMMRL